MTIASAATALFVPGHRGDLYQKATTAGADTVILDLEDAVGHDLKAPARDAAYLALSDENGLHAAVRINAVAEGGDADVEMLAAILDSVAGRLMGIIVPKAEDPGALSAVSERLDGVPIVALVETARGLAAAEALGRTPGVVRLAFGAMDFGVDIDATSEVVLDHARCELVLASRRAGLAPPIDSPNPEFRNLDAVRTRATASRQLGFGGQLCIHPAQVEVVRDSFQPTEEQIAWAEKVAAVGAGSATQVDGRMVDRPVYVRAVTLLERAGRSGR